MIPRAFLQSAAEFTNFPDQRGFRGEALFKLGEPGRDIGAFRPDLFQAFGVIAAGGCFPREHAFLQIKIVDLAPRIFDRRAEWSSGRAPGARMRYRER